ncbi:hypothetical protein H0H81_002763 [Sphagnurus paluster]|uniref:Uncharacterized protein n=1 Tax=Sphagnurus paluster TaxID=117069 RepID=A0A9P7FRV2_9AGAR|nr:hypothetical protein H0H81_002763 [Sphagnurus paluster]
MHIVDKGRSTVRQRKYQPVEVYQKYFGDKVSDMLKEAFDKGEVSTRGERMGLRCKVCTKAFEDEEEDIRALVAEKAEQLNDEWDREKMALNSGGHGNRNAAEYQDAIRLPALLRATIQPIAEATGWIFFIGSAGPDPSHQGNICLEKYYFGPTSVQTDNDFEDSYLGFASGFQDPFLKHAENCFPKDVRVARTLDIVNTQPMSTTDSPCAVLNAPYQFGETALVGVNHKTRLKNATEMENNCEEDSNTEIPVLDVGSQPTPRPLLPATPLHSRTLIFPLTPVHPNTRSPSEPGAPSSPISHAFERLGMSQRLYPTPGHVVTPPHFVIDPTLHSVAQPPAIVIDPALYVVTLPVSIPAPLPLIKDAALDPPVLYLVMDSLRQHGPMSDGHPSWVPTPSPASAPIALNTMVLLSPPLDLPTPPTFPISVPTIPDATLSEN